MNNSSTTTQLIATKKPLWLKLSLTLLAVVLIVAFAVYRHFMVAPLPTVSGEIEVNGISAEVKVNRDHYGVVDINAETDSDAYFALGFAHAQDRLWQLELQRRLSQGKLAEIFGQALVGQDIFFRTIGIYPAAQKAVNNLSAEVLAALQAYSEGINAFIDSGQTLPLEFTLQNLTPNYWQPADSVAWLKTIAFNLAGNYNQEIRHYLAGKYLTEPQLSQLFPQVDYQTPGYVGVKTDDETLQALLALLDISDNLEQQYRFGGDYVGSNVWAVSGKLTGSKGPMLANDPHMGLQIPSLWYAAKLKGDKLDSSGMTLIGLPTVIFGQNQHIAWGGTNMMADVQDLYFEQPNHGDDSQYLTENGYVDFIVEKHQIVVKAAEDASSPQPTITEVSVRRSINGPIISDLLPSLSTPVALRWTGLDRDDASLEGFYRISYAKNWPEFRAALSHFVAPALNFAYIDKENNIGHQGVGRVPVRPYGNGALPVVAGDGHTPWRGQIPWEQMPSRFNPPEGFFVNANNDNRPADYQHFISNQWALPYRATRISQMIELNALKAPLEFDHMRQIQGDLKDLSTVKLSRQALSTLTGSDLSAKERQALELILNWNGNADADSVASSIYYGWLRHMRTAIFADELSAPADSPAHNNHLSTIVSKIEGDTIADLIAKEPQWCDNQTTVAIEDCATTLKVALNASLDELTDIAGSDMANWHWGKLHITSLNHTPFGSVDNLKGHFNRNLSGVGSINTVNVSNRAFDGVSGYNKTFGAAFRQVIHFADDGVNQQFINSTGQSGHVSSDNYDDTLASFENLQLLPLYQGDVDVLVLIKRR